MAIFNVTYTAYEKNSSVVVSEGTMPVHADSSFVAESTVKAMFMNTNLIIRYTTNG
jgi:hypothetical protein